MIKKQLLIFIGIGFFTVCLDYFIYQSLFIFFQLPVNTSKTISFIGGTFFSYFTNKKITFTNKEKHSFFVVTKFIFLYGATLAVNVVANHLMLEVLSNFRYRVLFSFLVATVFSATLNFLGMKTYIFK